MLNGLFPENSEITATAGFMGSICHWIANKKNFREGVLCLITGTISAVYLSPIIAPMLSAAFQTTSDVPQSISAFFCGICGISLSGVLIDIVHFRMRSMREKEGNNEG